MYQNPIPIEKDFITGPEDICCNPDPYVIEHEGTYYCYSSGERGVNVLTSKTLEGFTHRGYAYQGAGEHSYWAPAVIHIGGVFYMYYSSLMGEETDDHKHYLRVAKSASPLGPFEYACTLIEDFAIDPHAFETDEGLFMLYSRNVTNDTPRIGTVIALDRMISPTQLAGEVRNVIAPSLDEEIFMKNRFGDGRDWHTVEGAFYYECAGRRYILYSGNAYTSPRYFIGYASARADTPLMEAEFIKQPSPHTYLPLVAARGALSGTGHNSVVKAPDGVTDVLVYHAVPDASPKDGKDHRQLCIDPLVCTNGALHTPAPTCEARSLQARAGG